MKIKQIYIEKFRSIQKSTIRINDLNAIVGENNSGKTSILRALNAFFNYGEEERYFRDNTHRHKIRNNTKIELTFENIPDEAFFNSKVEKNTLVVGIKYAYTPARKTIYYKVNGTEEISDDSLIEKIKNEIDYLYIPASRGNHDLDWNKNTIFNKLIFEYANKLTESRDVVSSSVITATTKLENSIFKKIEDKLSSLFPINEGYKFKINYTEDIDYQLLLNGLELKLQEKYKIYPIQEYGSGIKSLTIISIFRMLASLNQTNVVLGIEEPETNLHPQMQKQFINFLKGNKVENEIQILMATHSTVIIDALNHEDIILVRREAKEGQDYISRISQVSGDFWEKYNISEFKHYQFFNYRNSEFFFSKYIIITESKTDAQVIDNLISEDLGIKKSYISILNLEGISNLSYPYYLLKELSIPFSVVVDMDFFVSYLEDYLEKSRETETGFPMYKTTLNKDEILNNIFSTETEKKKLIEAINSGVYTKIFNFLDKYNLFTMKYCLEMDLITSKEIAMEYYQSLKVPVSKQNTRVLLLDNKKAIKKIELILKSLKAIEYKNYPFTIRKIKAGILAKISRYI